MPVADTNRLMLFRNMVSGCENYAKRMNTFGQNLYFLDVTVASNIDYILTSVL